MDGLTYTRQNEGRRLRAYWDDKGKCWTVGDGCKGPDPYRSPDATIGSRTVWTPQQCDNESARRYALAVRGAALDLGVQHWACLDEVRRAALADMAYQMGAGNCHGDQDPSTGDGGLAAFHATLSAVAARNWLAAHDAVLKSKYASDVPDRARRTALMLLTGDWPA